MSVVYVWRRARAGNKAAGCWRRFEGVWCQETDDLAETKALPNFHSGSLEHLLCTFNVQNPFEAIAQGWFEGTILKTWLLAKMCRVVFLGK